MFLEKVAGMKREEVHKRKNLSSLQEMQKKVSDLPAPREFLRALLNKCPMALIAEIKRASPSAGMIRQDADIQGIARKYQAGGASAISVLTEARFFHGALGHLVMVKEAVSLPVLQKDFIIDPFQIYEGRIAGADAVLLIAAMITQGQVGEFTQLIRDLGMIPLVEVHNEEDLEKVSGLPLPLIGINNRNLQTLEVNLEVTCHLIKKIPQGTMVISESGIKNREDVKRLQQAGARGVLVGEVLMRSADPATKIRELLGR
jgi:indole-3-glycerol phosphate synthase